MNKLNKNPTINERKTTPLDHKNNILLRLKRQMMKFTDIVEYNLGCNLTKHASTPNL